MDVSLDETMTAEDAQLASLNCDAADTQAALLNDAADEQPALLSGDATDAPALNVEEYTVYVAEITGAHGVSGNVRIRPIGTVDVAIKALQSVKTVLAKSADGTRMMQMTLSSVRKQPSPKGAWIARFKDTKDRNDAEALYGLQLFVRDNERPALPEGQYYVDEILGAEVVTDAGRALGTLTEILDTPANEVYVTDKGALIPVVDEFIVSLDAAAKRIVVRDVPGLLDEA